MCMKMKMPEPTKLADAPDAPAPLASAFKIAERRPSVDGEIDPNTARNRRTLRTDLKVARSGSGVNVARMN
jgi:hypothetical protein